ncbi:hypothetical protein [Flavivirga rizhaonensis]|uniref:Uncharacterized protein n=1 Tax=Flavivirga rizhaonensis TaxID=2559571 RepID=A0A4S1DYV1_9FLAO|nr:hypothetical protein [Flavivirga rizhaonensis]TGV03436.1 hypothetical protein EM932_07120 [Flavivirga rizhaonensis]
MKKVIGSFIVLALAAGFYINTQSDNLEANGDYVLDQLFTKAHAQNEGGGGIPPGGNPTEGTCTITTIITDSNGKEISRTSKPGVSNECPSGSSVCEYSCT